MMNKLLINRDFSSEQKIIVYIDEIDKAIRKYYYNLILSELTKEIFVNIYDIMFCFDKNGTNKLSMDDIINENLIITLYLLVKLVGMKNIVTLKLKLIVDKIIDLINMSDYINDRSEKAVINMFCLSKLTKKLYQSSKSLSYYGLMSDLIYNSNVAIYYINGNIKNKIMLDSVIKLYEVLNNYYYKLYIVKNIDYVKKISRKYINKFDWNQSYKKELNITNEKTIELYNISLKTHSIINYFAQNEQKYEKPLTTIEYCLDYCKSCIIDNIKETELLLCEHNHTDFIKTFKNLYDYNNPNTLFYDVFANMLTKYYDDYENSPFENKDAANNNLLYLYIIYRNNFKEEFNKTIELLKIDYPSEFNKFCRMNALLN